MKTLLFFAVLVTLVIATWLFIPLLQGRDADFETRLALFQGRGGDFVDTPSEATPTPPSQTPEAAPSRPLSGPAESVEAGGATGKAAETSIGEEPGDRPSIIENGQTRELGQKPLPLAPPVDPENDTAASATDAVRTQQDATLAFLVRQRLRTLGLDPGQLTLDSELGPQARAAIKKYQREHSLPVDGQVSVALLDHLDRVLSGGGRTGEEDAATKVAEAPPAPPPDQPGSADTDSARAESLPTPGTEPSEEALSQRPPPGGGRTGEEGAATKVAEAPPAPPADQPGSADMDSARAERLPTPGTEPSEDPLLEHLEQVLLDHARTGEEGAAPASESAESAASPVADATRGDESLIFLVQARLRQLGLHPGPMTLNTEPGPQTRAAIREYQREHSLPVDGQVSVALLDHLEWVLLDRGQIIEEGAAKKVAEAPPAPPADRPGSAGTEEARAEDLQRPGAGSSGDPVVARGRPGRTGEKGAEAGSSRKPSARVGGYEHFQKGFAAAKDGRQDLAIDHYTRAVESGDLSQPHLAYAFSNRGVVYWAMGLFDRAIEDFDEAVRLKPDYAPAYHNRGIAYHDRGLDERAIADLDNAIRLEPDYATAYFNRGLTYDKKGLYNRASDDYSKAILVQPDLDSAYFNRGRMYEAKGRQPSALQDFQRAYSLAPSDPNYRAKMKELGLLQ